MIVILCLGNGSDTSVILFYTFHVSILHIDGCVAGQNM